MPNRDGAEQPTLSPYSGRGVKVAIVDSGIDPQHPKLGRIKGGVEFAVNDRGKIISGLGLALADKVGHGTACAGIVHKVAPAAELYSVRIFDESLMTDGRLLVAALRWAIEQRMDVVNLSLGTTDSAYNGELEQVCREAVEKGIILLAATHGEDLPSCPALWPEVIGVVGGQVHGHNAYYYRAGADIECIARGDKQKVCWLERREVEQQGSSFAVPYMTGIVALLREARPQAPLKEIRQALQEHALNRPLVLSDLGDQRKTGEHRGKGGGDADLTWSGKAVLYPYTQGMQVLVRFADLLPFAIVGVVDQLDKGLVGKDAGEAIGIASAGVVITADLSRACDGADTLILGDVASMGNTDRGDVLRECVEIALRQNLHVFSFSPVPPEKYADLHELAATKNRRLSYPWIDGRKALAQSRQLSKEVVDVPVVGIFGTSVSQNKFTLQLALRRGLLARGYRLGQLGTEPHAQLFGINSCLPMCLPLQYYSAYLAYQMRELGKRRPDLILVGSPSSTIPCDVQHPRTGSLLSLAFLLGTRPDVCILVVNSTDPEDYIRDTLDALRSIGKTRVLALAMSDGGRRQHVAAGQSWHVQEGESTVRLAYLQQRFSLPVVSVLGGEASLLALLEEYFAAEEGRCRRRA